MRFQKGKVSARATALALVLGVVGVLATALPAWALTPAVTGVAPASGVRGTSVTITGTSFNTPPASSVTINGAAATFTIGSDTSITATVPCAATTGAGRVVVTNADGSSADVAADDFTVNAATAPTITSFSPTSGSVGTLVTITGTNFCGATSVMFNTTAATSFSVVSGTSITATVPTGATTGPLHVTTPVAPTANSATSFTVAGVPTITSFSPTSGNVGTSVTITGTNLTGVTAVRFNGVTATFTTSTATSVTATVPTGATTGKITVTTPGGTATSANDFTVTTGALARSVTFGFNPNSRVSGQVNVANGTAACRSLVPVVIQKQSGGAWKWVDTTATRKSGSFKTYIPPSNGNFRVKVNKITLANGVVCAADTSNVVHS